MNIILAYLFYFIAASASPLQRRWLAVNKNVDNNGQIRLAFQVTCILSVLSVVILFFQPFFITGNTFKLVSLAILCGIIGASVYVLSYKAQKHVEAGISSLVSNIYTPITIVLATLFLSEKLTVIQILGTALLLVGVIVVSKKHRIGKFKFDRYFLMMLLSGIILGVLLTAERALQKETGFAAATMLSWWFQCIFLGIATLVFKSPSVYSKKDITVTGGLRFLQSISWVSLVFIVGNLSLVSAVTTFKVVIMFVAGALFLGEKDDIKRKVIGSIVAVLGLFLMK